MEKLVSIISPSYNGARYLPHFFDGVLSQTYKNVELIFVDDGSTDDTKRVVDDYTEKFNESKIRLIYIFQTNQGQAAAINAGLKVFSGDYLMWVDSDDFLLPENVEEKVRFLEENPDCGFVQCLAEMVDASEGYRVVRQCGRRRPRGADRLFEDLIYERDVLFCPGVIMCRAEAVRRAIPSLHIYESREGQNWQLMLPLAYTSRCGYIEKVLFQIVMHDDSHSRRERDFIGWLGRYAGFTRLLDETIASIAQMPEEEKLFWHGCVRDKYLKKEFVLTSKHVNELREELRRCGTRLSLGEMMEGSALLWFLRKMKAIARK